MRLDAAYKYTWSLVSDGNNKTQYQVLLQKTQHWANTVCTGHLNWTSTWLDNHLLRIHYVLPVSNLTQHNVTTSYSLAYTLACQQLVSPGHSIGALLLHAPPCYYSLGVPDIYA